MKKIDLGQVVQILANLGVIASIAFLAIQVRQNSDVQRAQARAARAQIRINGLAARTDNPALLAAFSKQVRGEPLTELEQTLVEVDARSILIGWQYIWGELREGLIEDADVPIKDWKRAYERNAALRRVWQADADMSFRPDFAEWMKRNIVSDIAEPELPDPQTPGATPGLPE